MSLLLVLYPLSIILSIDYWFYIIAKLCGCSKLKIWINSRGPIRGRILWIIFRAFWVSKAAINSLRYSDNACRAFMMIWSFLFRFKYLLSKWIINFLIRIIWINISSTLLHKLAKFIVIYITIFIFIYVVENLLNIFLIQLKI